VDSAPSCSASLSRQALRRPSSSVRAVCVNAHVRICAVAASNGRPYRDSRLTPSGDDSCLVGQRVPISRGYAKVGREKIDRCLTRCCSVRSPGR
jgi:hypothetical protein